MAETNNTAEETAQSAGGLVVAMDEPGKDPLGSMNSLDMTDDTMLIQDDGDLEIVVKGAHQGTSTIPEASFNMMNSIVGAGIIGMPFALEQAGLIMGVLLIIIVGVITDYSILLLVKSGNIVKKRTYQDLVLFTLGKWGFYALTAAQFMFPFFGMLAYQIIVGQTLPKVFDSVLGETFLSNRLLVIVIMNYTVMLPVSVNKDLEALARWSFVALAGVFIAIMAVMIQGAQAPPPPDRGDPVGFINDHFIQSIGVISFAYVCHHNTFLVYDSLKQKNERTMATVVHISVGLACLASIILAVSGYLPFGGATEADILDNFDQDDAFINFARVAFSCTIMLTYPIEMFVCREVLHNLFREGKETTDQEHYGVSLLLNTIILGVALLTDNLGVVLELNGVLSATLLAFVLPGLVYIKTIPGPVISRAKLPAVALTIFGVAVLILGTSLILKELSE